MPLDQGHAAPEQESLDMSVCAGQALMVRHSFAKLCDRAAPAPPLLPSSDSSDSEFLSCDEDPQHEQLNVPVRNLGELEPSGVRPCGRSPGRDVCQRARSDLALRYVQDQVQNLPWADCKAGEGYRSNYIHHSERLRLHYGPRSDGLRYNDLACHRRSHPHGRRRDHAAKVKHCIPLRHQKGDAVEEPSPPQGYATGAANGTGTEHFRLYGQGDSSSEAEDCSDCHSWSGASSTHEHAAGQPPHIASDNSFVPAEDSASDLVITHDDPRPQHDHEGRQEDDQRGVRCESEYGCQRCHYGEAFDRAGGGVGRPSSGALGTRGLASATGRSADSDLNGHGIHVSGDGGNNASPHRRAGRLQSRYSRLLGAGLAALVATCAVDRVVPPQSSLPEPSDDIALSGTQWPVLSPEIGVVVPQDPGMAIPQAWQAVEALDMTKRATRAQLQQWLGPQAWKVTKGSHVGLVELYTGRGRLSDAFESLCEGSEAIRLGHMYGQELRSPLGQWFTLSLIELCKPDDVFISFPCKGWCRWSSFNERREPGTRLKILRERLEGRKDLNLLFKIADLQSQGQRHTHAENPQSSLAWSHRGFAECKFGHGFVTFDQCPLGLRHPRSGRPIRKATTLFTTRYSLADHMSQYKCACCGLHDKAEGTFRGRSITSWCEDYTERLALAFVQGMKPGLVESDTILEPPHYDGHIQSNPVERCYVGHDNIIHRAFPAEEPNNPAHEGSEEASQGHVNCLQSHRFRNVQTTDVAAISW